MLDSNLYLRVEFGGGLEQRFYKNLTFGPSRDDGESRYLRQRYPNFVLL